MALISLARRRMRRKVQWLYFAYLAAVKSQNGGAMSLGRTASFLDIYIERDFKAGVLNQQQAQELIDHFIMNIVWCASCVRRNLIRCSPATQSGYEVIGGWGWTVVSCW